MTAFNKLPVYQNVLSMKKSFLDYYKEILQKVSFDQELFKKELNKALNSIDKEDIQKLREWIIDRGLQFNMIPVKVMHRK